MLRLKGLTNPSELKKQEHDRKQLLTGKNFQQKKHDAESTLNVPRALANYDEIINPPIPSVV